MTIKRLFSLPKQTTSELLINNMSTKVPDMRRISNNN
jgi:hypothetical protein